MTMRTGSWVECSRQSWPELLDTLEVIRRAGHGLAGPDVAKESAGLQRLGALLRKKQFGVLDEELVDGIDSEWCDLLVHPHLGFRAALDAGVNDCVAVKRSLRFNVR